MKSSPINKESPNVIQWNQKDTDYNNNFSPSNNNNLNFPPRKESNNNSKEKFSNLINANNKDSNVNSNDENPADLNDYLATHKMLIELEVSIP